LYDEAIKDFNKAGDLLEKDGKVKEAVNSYKSAQELSRKLNSRK
jgi:predicted RNA polymerase sigma factor